MPLGKQDSLQQNLAKQIHTLDWNAQLVDGRDKLHVNDPMHPVVFPRRILVTGKTLVEQDLGTDQYYLAIMIQSWRDRDWEEDTC